MRIVLGSASPARRALLAAAGVPALVHPSTVDEDALIAAAGERAADPWWITEHLATAKAQDVAATLRGARLTELPRLTELAATDRVLVIGADSMLSFDGQVLGKARSAQEVRDRWAAMSGGTGELVTGQVVVDVATEAFVAATVGTTIRFGSPDAAELEAYIASGEPMAVAGSCTIDGLGGPFIDGVDGDHTNVIGLSLPTLRAMLRTLGVRWTDLWSPAVGTGGQER